MEQTSKMTSYDDTERQIIEELEEKKREKMKMLEKIDKTSRWIPAVAENKKQFVELANKTFGEETQSLEARLSSIRASADVNRLPVKRPSVSRSRPSELGNGSRSTDDFEKSEREHSGQDSDSDEDMAWQRLSRRLVQKRRRIQISSSDDEYNAASSSDEDSEGGTYEAKDFESETSLTSHSRERQASSLEESDDGDSSRDQCAEQGDTRKTTHTVVTGQEDESQGTSKDMSNETVADENPATIDDAVDEDEITDEDLELEAPDIAREIERVRKSKLTMTIQGFRSKQHGRNTATERKAYANEQPVSTRYDPTSVNFNGKVLEKGRCYHYTEAIENSEVHVVVGILRFSPDQEAKCVLIVPFDETILGMEEEDVDFIASFKPCAYVQVHEDIPPLSLDGFGNAVDGLEIIPALMYEAQTPGAWQQFGYFYRPEQAQRRGIRTSFRLLELFAGCGGMHQGFKTAGFTTVKAVESDPITALTFTTNNQGVPTYVGDVEGFLERYKEGQPGIASGGVVHLHASPPCQGFSGANRVGGRNDASNNALSL